ncbi:hypothetical protein V8E52_001994 [Russula decolorans]|jgi:2-hydroxyglutarate dehydrogenase
MAGNVRFGPDIDWLSAPDGDEEVWETYLSPDEERARSMHPAGLRYSPGVKPKGFQSDYAGIRPKLAPAGAPFHDFVVPTDYAEGSKGTEGSDQSVGYQEPWAHCKSSLGRDGRRSKTNEL